MKSLRKGAKTVVLMSGMAVFSQFGLTSLAQAGPTETLLKCSIIGDDERRLACYDIWTNDLRASGRSIDQALAPAPAVVPAPTQPAEVAASSGRSGIFNFGLPFGGNKRDSSDDNFGQKPVDQPDLPGKVDFIDVKVATIKMGAYNNFTITLDNGQVWQQTDEKKMRLSPGDTVRIRRGAMGGYFLQKSGKGKSSRVTRKK